MRLFIFCALFGLLAVSSLAQTPLVLAERMAATIMRQNPDSLVYPGKTARWEYELGVVLNGFENLWLHTGKGAYFQYLKKQMDFYIGADGGIRTYQSDEYNIDMLPPGRMCLTLFEVTRQMKYKQAADRLRDQLRTHPRTAEGGFWHKKIYPNQMWLDGLYMGQPFFTQYSVLFGESVNFDDIANQFVWMEQHARDAKTGLLYHGWDASKQMAWADPQTGCSPNFWGRAMGWYAIALVDVLDHFPANHPRRAALVSMLQRTAAAVTAVQDEAGLWWQVMNRQQAAGNYREASASSMFCYALAKGVRQGHLDRKYLAVAEKAFAGIQKHFLTTNADGSINLEKTVSVSGLGGKPYRDGSYEYYIAEPIRQNDLKGVGPFINACLEMERAHQAAIGQGKTVLFDYFFNNEYRKGWNGQSERFHYTLDDRTNSGYHVWGQIFNQWGAATGALLDAPSKQALQAAQVYIICDPDTRKETERPNFVQAKNVKAIKNWVKKGGTLVLFANDTSNCEIPYFNTLAQAFGITFSTKNRNFVKNDYFPDGTFALSGQHPVLGAARKLFIKELSVLNIHPPAESLLTEGGDVIFATVRYGKGRVLALGDPWIYNEYLDGRKLPAEYDNFEAARALSRWLLSDGR